MLAAAQSRWAEQLAGSREFVLDYYPAFDLMLSYAKLMVKGKLLKKIPLAFASFLLPFLIAFTFYNLYYSDRIYPNTFIAGISIGTLNKNKAVKLLQERIKVQKVVLSFQDQNFEITPKEINLVYDFEKSASSAYELDRTGNITADFKSRILAVLNKREFGLNLSLDEKKLSETLSAVAGSVETEPTPPSVKIVDGKAVVNKGKKGDTIDMTTLKKLVGELFSSASAATIKIPLISIDPTITDEEAKIFAERAENLLGRNLVINFEFQSFPQKGDDLNLLLDPKGGYSQEKITNLISYIKNLVNRSPQNPTFVFQDGKVKEFAPAKEGVKTNEEDFMAKILISLEKLEKENVKEIAIEVPVEKTSSEIQTGDVNDLGIKELIGRGVSRFRGSIPSRIYNVNLAAGRLNGILVKPGDTLSFNDALGDVSKFTGYKEAYIIKDGRTILGDGGGVCQVSTTLFRSALNAGLPIIERRAHAYRVGYYEQDSPPGLDATVYSPTTDLKIKNDTPGHILIQTQVNTKTATLVFELYGTADGRVASTTKPSVTDSVAPPPDLYQDDPTLPAGQVKQVDYKAWGAKVVFSYKVEKDGQIVYQKTFSSNYRPWQAVYLRGTAPVQ